MKNSITLIYKGDCEIIVRAELDIADFATTCFLDAVKEVEQSETDRARKEAKEKT